MKIILLQDIPKLGKKFDIKQVNNGYARNLLLPKKMAMVATKKSTDFIRRLKESEKKSKTLLESGFQELTQKLKAIKLTLKAKTNKEGKLFAAIDENKIRLATEKQLGIKLPAGIRVFTEKPIKTIGSHSVQLILGNKKTSLSIVVQGLNQGKTK